MCHCVSTASSWRVYGACTAFALSVIVSIALSQRRQGAATATIALPRRSHYVHRRLPLRYEQLQQNGKSSLVIAIPIVCSSFVNIIMAVEPQQVGLFLAYMQVQDDANVVHLIERRSPQGVGEFGYANGWTSTGGCSTVTIIGLCMSSGMKTLPVTLIS